MRWWIGYTGSCKKFHAVEAAWNYLIGFGLLDIFKITKLLLRTFISRRRIFHNPILVGKIIVIFFILYNSAKRPYSTFLKLATRLPI